MEKLNTYTNDLLTYNNHFLSAVRSQKTSDKIKNTKAVSLLHDIDIALTTQINGLERFDDLIDSSKVEALKDKIASLFGNIAGNIDTLRTDPVSKIIRDDYTALSMLASGYTMLHTAALISDNTDLATFAQSSLSRVAQLITETSQILPYIVAEELTEDAEEATKIAKNSLEETQKAWNVENTMVEA
jgi:hypothetical protein